MTRPVVLGVDGSAPAAAAVDCAANEAAALGVGLRVVHAYVWPILYASLANVPFRAGEWEPGPPSRKLVEAAASRALAAHPGLVVDTAVTTGDGGRVLVDESAGASLVVVGGAGVGGLAGLLAGPVALHVASHAHCPVIVARARRLHYSAEGRVVVGVDGSPSGQVALDFACAWAARHGTDVDAVYAAAAGVGRVLLDGWIADASTAYPCVHIRPLVVYDTAAAEALVSASRSARMVVVGSHRRGRLASMMHGSVGHALIRRAQAPVVVAHGAYGEPRRYVSSATHQAMP